MVGRIALLVASVAIAMPVRGQGTLSPHTSVRITTIDQRSMQGRLVSGDLSSLTIATGDARAVVRRDSIATISAASIRSKGWAIGLGATTGVLGGLFLGAVAQGICESSNGCPGSFQEGLLIGGGFGLVAGGAAGAVVGAFLHKWSPASASVRVTGRPVGAAALEGCATRASEGAAELEVGMAGNNRRAARLGLTALCRSAFSVGAEIGDLGSEIHFSSSYVQAGTTFTTTIRTFGSAVNFIGPFVEVPFHAPLNPRLVASAGYYRRSETSSTQTIVYKGTTSQLSSSSSDSVLGHPGASLGLAVSLPLWRHLSIGADVRGHVMAGSGLIRTIGVTARIAP